MITSTKCIPHSWGTETILHFSGGSVVRIFVSKSKITVEVVKFEKADLFVQVWQHKHPGRKYTTNHGGLEENQAMGDKLVAWFNSDPD